ncbi:hypothetical protein COS55_02505 [Candidatus Shapirobacteria bacterium CG03_land_8_20_14_0_80_40_19]|uniref:Transcriptional regulator n=3 Tax=Candidatus Shapironibacteriota TaxID=1752721 RepID=A0A2M7BDA2_9BACT|nr:MAG: hypothetical protein COV89_03230 [Candidatus Shapirobacteria bacterium CG11_big_fil_rev_8_21_14_0_20_40_12]PIV01079.1 MAG: hypothetical protein COS55_02505 [Candidatus Shapirobacteria bacterium CG03_land_8_20_14_0_80_40_19]PJC28499.1 MAG: hypothetical protein CO053_04310 [Candidatus Shapirobacteria bacterium CG_4_9_14_0_2_um_filter_40_11]
MKARILIEELTQKNIETFSTNDLRRLFPKDSNNVTTIISRMVKNGIVIPVCRGRYRLKQTDIEVEKLAQNIYYPSYISFESALSKYGIINQGTYLTTLATTRHSKKITIDNIECIFRTIKPKLYFGFNLINGIYIAEAEKAVLDTLYFIYLGKLKISFTDWYLKDLDITKLKKYANRFDKSFLDYIQKTAFPIVNANFPVRKK